MYEKSARIYDAIYAAMGKDYRREAEILHELIQAHKMSDGNRLLDVACGTGQHLAHLKRFYHVEGLDVEGEMLALARARNPEVTFHQGNMLDFDLRRTFDVIVCLFSAIGYTRTEANLRQAVATMAGHLEAGGVLIVEPWFAPDAFRTGNLHAVYVDEPDLKVARMNVSERAGNLAVLNMHYLVGIPQGVTQFTELHELGLFPSPVYQGAIEAAGLAVVFDQEGLIGRGLFLGVRRSSPA